MASSPCIIVVIIIAAFRCTLNSIGGTYGCKHVLNVTIHTQYDIRCAEDCSLAPELAAGSTILVLGSNSDCENCFEHEKLDLQVGWDYLVAGETKTRIGDCYGTFWKAWLITAWQDSKFNHATKKNKMMSTYISKGNEARGCSGS